MRQYSQGTLSKEEVENLLRHGAYDIFNEDKAGEGEAASNDFVEQDIDSIMQRRARTVVHENTGSKSGAAGGTFSKASFTARTPDPNNKNEEIDIEDPDFWKKMIGEGSVEEEDENIVKGRRKRAKADYTDQAYNQQLNAQLYSSNDDAYDFSDESDEEDSNEDVGQERGRWGGKSLLEWKKDDVENLMKGLTTFGYGQIPWQEFLQHLNLTKEYGIPEVCLVLGPISLLR